MKIGTVVVLYNNVIEETKKLLKSLLLYSDMLVVVDNSELQSTINGNKNQLIISSKILLISNGKNLGIATAQNQGINKLLEKQMDYIFFFDQDSKPNSMFQCEMVSRFQILEREINLGILAPTINQLEKSHYISKHDVEVNEVISSGSLIKSKVFLEIGGMEDRLFIDYVDFEFCWRARLVGYKIIKTTLIVMEHSVGKKIYHIGKWNVYIPAIFRYYFQYRNGTWLLKRNYVPGKWKKREKVIRFLTPFFILLFLPNKIKCLHYIMKGLKNAKSDKSGFSGSSIPSQSEEIVREFK